MNHADTSKKSTSSSYSRRGITDVGEALEEGRTNGHTFDQYRKRLQNSRRGITDVGEALEEGRTNGHTFDQYRKRLLNMRRWHRGGGCGHASPPRTAGHRQRVLPSRCGGHPLHSSNRVGCYSARATRPFSVP